MARTWQAGVTRRVSIRLYIGLWAGSILVSFLALTTAWYIAGARLRRMKDRVFADACTLDAGRLLEITLLAERREDLLWRATQNAAHRAQRDASLREAGRAADGLAAHVTSREEELIVGEIRAKLQAFRVLSTAATPPSVEAARQMADDLLAAVHRYLEHNKADMQATMAEARRLHALVDRWSVVLLLLVGVVLAVGSLGLMSRVVRPTVELTRAARSFGQGDLAARATVSRDDELGALCRTFNNMADDIAAREDARLIFVAAVAHDLRSPLATIGLAARMLRRRTSHDDLQAEWLGHIISHTERLENLTQDLTDTVQVATGRLTLSKANVDLTELARSIQREQADAFPDRTIVFEGHEECGVLADRSRLERVAVNLISNAAKYSAQDSTVVVRVEREGRAAVLSVADQGLGIPPDELGIIFQPFGRARHTSHLARGAGLGLYVVKEIVEAHGGHVSIHSEVGAGTTVHVVLPLDESGHAEASAPKAKD